MTILHTFGGDVSVLVALLAMLIGILGFCGITVGSSEHGDSWIVAFAGLVLVVFAVIIGANAERPVRHEVIITDGYVIDAARYEIVEQRGQIYVIEEREKGREQTEVSE